MRAKNRILIVDDDKDIRNILSDFLTKEGYAVWQAVSAREALELLGKMRIDVMFLDLKMPGMDGFDLLQKIRGDFPELYICILTAFDDKKTKQRAKELGADGFIGKVFNADELFRRVELAISEVEIRIKRRLLAEEEGFHQIIGNSGTIQKVIQTIKKVAPTDVTVLIEGETGTGKGLVARAIHEESHRAHGPFAHVSCAAFPSEILDVESHGRKGDFTCRFK